MKFLSTTICTLCILFAFSQSSVVHIESQHLQKRSTEYYGSLADKPNNSKVDEDAFINYNPAIQFNGTDDYLDVKTIVFSIFPIVQLIAYDQIISPNIKSIDISSLLSIQNIFFKKLLDIKLQNLITLHTLDLN